MRSHHNVYGCRIASPSAGVFIYADDTYFSIFDTSDSESVSGKFIQQKIIYKYHNAFTKIS